ncbi:helix-turn-helix transcriptional regulator [Vagococcus vulneris]|uniref:WCX domain-containing protein n=1 Tax=Vagococcus vulneris TaxID=1977869 RepID=A0A430A0E8_9ENTE|nr:WYL domain-containing protein [Vagococcus vulneris]RST99808.1 hypothetical protein CBF37_03525 [Vagococcus vulneris]
MNAQERLLAIFLDLIQGKVLRKQTLIDTYQVSANTIQRDLATIDLFLGELADAKDSTLSLGTINRKTKGHYHLDTSIKHTTLTDEELLLILKILFASRIFKKEELNCLTQKLYLLLHSPNKVRPFLLNEQHYYHGVSNIDLLQPISIILEAITTQRLVEFQYTKNNVTKTFQRVPEDIFFSDLYFFMICSSHRAQDDRDFNQLNKFRINNMVNLRLLPQRGKKQYAERFEGGILRKQTALPFLGNPITLIIDFFYDPVYVLDRFPDSKIVKYHTDGSCRIEIQANDGYGVKMWLLGQGSMVKVISPNHMKDYILADMKKTFDHYK